MAALGGGWADALRKAARAKAEPWPPFDAASPKPDRQWPPAALPLAGPSAHAISAASASPAQPPPPASATYHAFPPSAKHSPPRSPDTPPMPGRAHVGALLARGGAAAAAQGGCSAMGAAPSAQEMRALEEANALLNALFGPNADLAAVIGNRRNPSTDGSHPSPRPEKADEKAGTPRNAGAWQRGGGAWDEEAILMQTPRGYSTLKDSPRHHPKHDEQRYHSKVPCPSPRPPPAQRRSAAKKKFGLGAQSTRVTALPGRPSGPPLSAAELPAPSSFFAGLPSSAAAAAQGGESPVVALFGGEFTFPAALAELWALLGGRGEEGANRAGAAAERRECRQGGARGEWGVETAAQGCGLAEAHGQVRGLQAESPRGLAPSPKMRPLEGSGAGGCSARAMGLNPPSSEMMTRGAACVAAGTSAVVNATSAVAGTPASHQNPVEAEATALLNMVSQLLSTDQSVTVNGGDCTEMIKGAVEKFRQELSTKLPARAVGQLAGAAQGEGGEGARRDGGKCGDATARMEQATAEGGGAEGGGEGRSAPVVAEQQPPFQSQRPSVAPAPVHVPDGGFSLDHPAACAMWEPSNAEPAPVQAAPAEPAPAQTASVQAAAAMQFEGAAMPEERLGGAGQVMAPAAAASGQVQPETPLQLELQFQHLQQLQFQQQQQQGFQLLQPPEEQAQQQLQQQQQQQQQQQCNAEQLGGAHWSVTEVQQQQQPPHNPFLPSHSPPPYVSTHAFPLTTHHPSHPFSATSARAAAAAAPDAIPAASPGFEMVEMAPPTPAGAAPAPAAPSPVNAYPPHPTEFPHTASALSLALAPVHASASHSASAPLSGPGSSSASGSAAASANCFPCAAGPPFATDASPADAQRAADFVLDFPLPVHLDTCLHSASAITELPLFPASAAAREAAAAISSLRRDGITTACTSPRARSSNSSFSGSGGSKRGRDEGSTSVGDSEGSLGCLLLGLGELRESGAPVSKAARLIREQWARKRGLPPLSIPPPLDLPSPDVSPAADMMPHENTDMTFHVAY
ncbi:hypothetical protein CLOM_g10220 [Closterium sp. NIES-68]|nr:hypothetical protein CLOM_g10220 [Closterium sp. NIES-68]GJP64993.1 hypothetical protein CLOP_g21922 [Closterium sp. NIES-67]